MARRMASRNWSRLSFRTFPGNPDDRTLTYPQSPCMFAKGDTNVHANIATTTGDVLSRLPVSVTDNRVLKTDEVAAMTGYSVAHWREMYRDGRAPAPIRLSARRYGWKVSTILAWLDEKAAA